MLYTAILNERHLQLTRKEQQHCSINLRGNSKKNSAADESKGETKLAAPLLSCHAGF